MLEAKANNILIEKKCFFFISSNVKNLYYEPKASLIVDET